MIEFILNGENTQIEISPDLRLIDLLRDHLHLTGTKEGCGVGECGACTVIVDKKAVCSCLVLAKSIAGKEILTIEGLIVDGELDRIQKAFMEKGAIQCGFCTPGMVMSAKALLMSNPNPTVDEIKTAISGNLCRCTGYVQIVDAISSVTNL